ncbi:MAG: hypothetical protein NC548_56745 [Lachnospiraceae bacterium]|nr:hypothetical protein [Lachnospiraceae bacterium]
MKYRSDFVTNSSSSSYTCDICGHTESGWDLSLSEAEMVECVNGHTICTDEMLQIPKNELIKIMLEWACDSETTLSEKSLERQNYDDLVCDLLDLDDLRYNMPEAFCPICQFIEYSEYDLARYLEKVYGVSRDEVFAVVKQANKRRRKLYENEYITFVCQKFSLNPAEIVASWKEKFGTYANFVAFLNGR